MLGTGGPIDELRPNPSPPNNEESTLKAEILDFGRLLQSKTFAFVIGEKTFMVHRSAAAKSKHLIAIMSDTSIESFSLKDIDRGDFTRFCQFAYTGDYRAPLPIVVKPDGSLVDGLPALDRFSVNSCRLEHIGSTLHGTREKMLQTWNTEYQSQNWNPPQSLWPYLAECKPIENPHSNEDLTHVLLTHVNMYAFADKYQVDDTLHSLCTLKLYHTLDLLPLTQQRANDVTTLARYIYNGPTDADFSDLKTMVTLYAGLNMDMMVQNDNFLSLLREGGEFAKEFWKKVAGAVLEMSSEENMPDWAKHLREKFGSTRLGAGRIVVST